MTRRSISLALLAAFLITGAAAFLTPRLLPHGGAAVVGGPFALLDPQGHAVTDRDFRGKWMLVYFGYTHCPDACPTALSDIAEALSQLGPDRTEVAPIFITVDPARDTPQIVGNYVRAFDPAIIGLSGSDSQIDAVLREYKVYAAKHAEKDGSYSMDHSSLLYFMDKTGALDGLLGGDADAKAIIAKLRQLGA